MTPPDLPGSAIAATEPRPSVRLRDSVDLVAAVPVLIGFHPRESLVLIAMGGPSGRRLGLTLRVDLPPPEHADAVVEHAVQSLLLDHPAGAAVIVLARCLAGEDEPPHADLARSVIAELVGRGIAVATATWAESTAAGARWACYDDCRCSGVMPDPSSTAFAAAAVLDGLVVRNDRAELERMVAPADPERIRRREELLIRAVDEAAGRPDAGAEGPSAGWQLVEAAIAAAADGRLELDDRSVVDLAVALADLTVRDAALTHCTGSAAAAAEQLWAALARETPDPEAAEPAVLLAACALLRGDGALANVALERAEQAWPGHRLGGLLQQVADAGMRPAQVRECLRGGAAPPPDSRRSKAPPAVRRRVTRGRSSRRRRSR